MSKQQEPIKKEKIDNPDGTYTINEVYDKPNFGCYMSCKEVFNSADRMLNGSYYDDKKFKKLLFTDTREYLDNGQYYKTQIWETPQGDGYISCKCLCDNIDKEIKAWFYEDKQFTDLLIYQEVEYLENDFTKFKEVWYNSNYSNEVYQDAKKRIIKEIVYNDTEFRNVSTSKEYFYNDDNSYKIMCLFGPDVDENIRSRIDYFDNKDQLLKHEFFYDANFSQLYSASTSKCSKNGEYTIKTFYENCDENDWKSTIEKYDKNTRFLSGIYKTSSKEHNQIIMKEKCIYNEDNTYDRYHSFNKQAKEKRYLSFIERYTDDDKFIFSKYYKDRNFKKLYYTCDRKYITDGHYIDNIVEDNFFGEENYKSGIFEANTNENWEKEKYYKNNDFTELLISTYQYINTNGNREKQLVYENDQGGWHSSIFETDCQNRIVKQLWYSDKEFKNVYGEEILDYQDDNNYTSTTIFHRPLKDNDYNRIEFYKNNKLYKETYYKDKKLTQLYATEYYEYLHNKKSVNKTVFEEPYKNIQSLTEYKNKAGKVYYSLGYRDKEFKNLDRTIWVKYTKSNQIRLRIYAQKQDGYNTKIEKYDNNKTLVYTKQYDTNPIFARILFWFA